MKFPLQSPAVIGVRKLVHDCIAVEEWNDGRNCRQLFYISYLDLKVSVGFCVQRQK